MISVDHIRLMARYNQWQNCSIYDAAATLSDAQRRENRGAFFGSIHGTLSHLMWGDRMWMSRFAGLEKPAVNIPGSADLYPDWEELKAERVRFDDVIVDWADGLEQDWTVGDLTWFSGATGREMTRPRWFLLTHFFNHQTHHRGQVHAMLTAAGAKPDDTDLMLMDPTTLGR